MHNILGAWSAFIPRGSDTRVLHVATHFAFTRL